MYDNVEDAPNQRAAKRAERDIEKVEAQVTLQGGFDTTQGLVFTIDCANLRMDRLAGG